MDSYTQRTELNTAQPAGTSAVYSYSDKGEKTSETITYSRGVGPSTVEFSHTIGRRYRPNGQLETLIYPDGTEIDYAYDAHNRLTQADLPGGGQIEWSAWRWQQPTRVQLPGAMRTLTFDGFQRPTQIRSQAIGSGSAQTPAGALIMDYRYRYDAAGNITQRQTEDGAFDYGYDPLDRLTQATPPESLQRDPAAPAPGTLPVEVYSYDPVHNRMSSQHQPGAWQYNQDNQLQSYGLGAERITYTYSANGHTTSETTGDPAAPLKVRTYRYNAAERLTQIDDNGQPLASYRYDPMGRRVVKQVGVETTWFIYADEGLIAELRADGSVKRGYGWKPQGLWGTDPLWLADKTGAGQTDWTTHVYHNDHLWTPQRMTDGAGTVSWSGKSEAFGLTETVTNAVENPLRFPGQYFDGESRTHYNMARDYEPRMGRYIASDPIGSEGGPNRYLYGEASPQAFIDPQGEVAWGLVLGAGSLVYQLYVNDFQLRCVNWSDVGLALVGGGVMSAAFKSVFRFRRGAEGWRNAQRWYKRNVENYNGRDEHLHHWLIPRGTWGKKVPDYIKNQPWNLNKVPAKFHLQWIHGVPLGGYLGTPMWASEVFSGSLLLPVEQECECK
jgi:RHS repeat-associated protein